MSNENKDYIFIKKLNVIYIDFDLSSHNEMVNEIGDSINLVFCNSLTKAFDMVKSNNYDVILCDLLESSQTLLKDFFNEFSQKIPIITVSSSIDPRVVYKAVKLGAKDHIHNNRETSKNLARVLHRTHLNWIREMERGNTSQLLNDIHTRSVLIDLIRTELPINQSTKLSVVNEIPINETLINIYNIRINDILAKTPSIIETLLRINFLKKEYIKQTLACPKCKALDISTNYFCDKCKKSKFIKTDLFVHNHCGKVNVCQSNLPERTLYCSYCNTYFKNNSTECINTHGYQCSLCSNTFTNPSLPSLTDLQLIFLISRKKEIISVISLLSSIISISIFDLSCNIVNKI